MLEKSADYTKKITQAKNDYINKMIDKLQNPSIAPKTYWAILIRLIYKKKFQQYHNYWLMIILFQIFVKRQIFSITFFSSICTPIQNTSYLPPVLHRTNARITSFFVTKEDILLIIKNFGSFNAHGWDNISIKMIKICGESTTVPLKIIFEQSLKENKFPEVWKKANIVPVHKKEDKNLIRNYRSVSLLPIFSKIYERVVCNALFNYFKDNKLFTSFQSGFLLGDSYIAQLLSIIHEIQTAFGNNPADDVRGVFLDISKRFDKVWHIGFLFKLKAYGVDDELLSLLGNYLENRQQRIVLNGLNSEWREINSGVPQGSVLEPLLLLIYINDLPDGITSICKIFVDDTSLFSKVLDANESTKKINFDLEKNSEWAFQWKMHINQDLNKQANEVIFSRKSKFRSDPPLTFNNDVRQCPHQKKLGIISDSKLDFNIHVDNKIKKCYRMIGIIKRLPVGVPRKALLTIYKSYIRPHLDYGDILYDKPEDQNFRNKLEKVQYKACLAITDAIQGTSRQKFTTN